MRFNVKTFCVTIILTIAILLLAVICYDAGIQLFVLHRIGNFAADMCILGLVALGLMIIHNEGKK